MLVSDPSKQLYSSGMKKIIEDCNKRRDNKIAEQDIIDAHDKFTKIRKNKVKSFYQHQEYEKRMRAELSESNGNYSEYYNQPLYIVEEIYNEQINCFFGIFPIIAYIIYFLKVPSLVLEDDFKGSFFRMLLDEKIMETEFFNTKNKELIKNNPEFIEFNKFFMAPTDQPNIDNAKSTFEIQLSTFKDLMSGLKRKLDAANLIPVELRVLPETESISKNEIFSLLPLCEDEPTYMYLILRGRYFQYIFKDNRDIGHAVTVSKIDNNGITLKNSWGEDWGVNGSVTVNWEIFSNISKSAEQTDRLKFSVILLLSTVLSE